MVLAVFPDKAFVGDVVVAHEAVAAVGAESESSEFDAEFKFGVERGTQCAIETVTQGFDVFFLADFDPVEMRSIMDIHQAEAKADRGNQVDEGIFAKEFPTEHPVGAVGEPFHVVQREGRGFDGLGVARDVYRVVGGGALGYLRRHEVDVEPGQELLVLGTDVHVHPEVVVVELLVVQASAACFGNGIDVRSFFVGLDHLDEVGAVVPCDRVHVVGEFLAHAAVVGTDRDEPADVVLFVNSFFAIGEGAGDECEQAESRNAQERGYLCFHKRFHC